MNKAVADDYEKVVNNSDDLGKVESISNVTLEEEEFFDAMEAGSVVEEGSDLDLVTSRDEQDEEFVDALGEQDWLTKQIAAI
ncbi:MAG: hypothetical protein TV42_03605 [Wolbachia endosymbiont of Dactylopius coccus]|nr:MAG: hypothetical protein TV42_03605 [Wolbachia endosymbiont of Dactylopius coccus]